VGSEQSISGIGEGVSQAMFLIRGNHPDHNSQWQAIAESTSLDGAQSFINEFKVQPRYAGWQFNISLVSTPALEVLDFDNLDP
jgi:hypothetical protein